MGISFQILYYIQKVNRSLDKASEGYSKSTNSSLIAPPPVSTTGWLKNQKQGYPSLHIFWKDKGSVSGQ